MVHIETVEPAGVPVESSKVLMLIDEEQVHRNVLKWIGSEEFKEAVNCCDQPEGFKAGAMWGAAMACILATTQCFKFPVKILTEIRIGDE